jgi:hypothetical protein
MSDITGLCFKKHGAYIREDGLQLAGKRTFIRTRQGGRRGELV